MTEDDAKARSSIWQNRGKRFTTGINVLVAVLLAFVLLGMVNYFTYRHCAFRFDIGWRGYYALSGKTLSLLQSLKGRVNIVVFFREGHEYYRDIRGLLEEYQHALDPHGQLEVDVEYVDPDRDLARTKELARKYDVRQANVIVFDYDGRLKYVEEKDIFDIEKIVDYQRLLSGQAAVDRKKTAFRGEQVFSSAIQSVTQDARPVVYFLTGHGERDIAVGNQAGYSQLARTMRRDNMDVRPLLLAETKGIPEDCSALVIAGPDRKLSASEIDILSGFLDRNGRVFILVDPATVTGLDKLLASWGVRLSPGVVVGVTSTARELFVTEYGDHPMTRNLKGVTTMFYMPRAIDATLNGDASAEDIADRPHVTFLSACRPAGWLEMNLNQNPPKFDEGVDRSGPIPIAVAVEKGPLAGIDVEIKPTRLLVVGDSYFVSNGGLSVGVGGNISFFMSGMNWLVEREALMAIAPKIPGELTLDMDESQLRRIYLLMGVGIPALVACVGFAVWLRRRR